MVGRRRWRIREMSTRMVGKLNDEKSEKFKAMVAFYLEKTKKIYKTQTARIFSERERERRTR